MGGRGAKGAAASEVISTSGVSVSAESRVSSPGVTAAILPAKRVSEPVKPVVHAEPVSRERGRTVPQRPLSSYESIYTDNKAQYGAFMKESDSRFAEKLTPDQRLSLKHYKGSGYVQLNKELRGMSAPTKYQQDHVKQLDAAFEGHELGRNIVAYRGFSAHIQHEVGKVYTDNGFMSTSLNPNRAFGGEIFLKVHASKKAKAAFIDSHKVYNPNEKSRLYTQEHEVLFARGAKYIVVGKSKVKMVHGEKEAWDVVLLD